MTTTTLKDDAKRVALLTDRANRLERIRREIAAGTYLTTDKLEAAVTGVQFAMRLPNRPRRCG